MRKTGIEMVLEYARRTRHAVTALAAVALGMVALAQPGLAGRDDYDKRQRLVEEARLTLKSFASDDEFEWFQDNIGRAKGIVVIPELVKGGFILGGSGGGGVLLGYDADRGGWSYPAFVTLGSITFGFQAGGEVSEIIMMIMTEDGLDAMMGDEFKLGGDVSVAVGPLGAGAKAQTADVLAFSRTKGLYGGLNLEGAVVATRNDRNRDYYGGNTRTRDIILKRTATNTDAQSLREAASTLTGR